MALRDLRRPQGPMTEAEHVERMAAAKARAAWELGDESWAGVIIAAYMNPEADAADLAREMEQ